MCVFPFVFLGGRNCNCLLFPFPALPAVEELLLPQGDSVGSSVQLSPQASEDLACSQQVSVGSRNSSCAACAVISYFLSGVSWSEFWHLSNYLTCSPADPHSTWGHELCWGCYIVKDTWLITSRYLLRCYSQYCIFLLSVMATYNRPST